MNTSVESCPFCKSAANSGATVCASCGAYKGTAGDNNRLSVLWLVSLGLSLWGVFITYLAFFGKKTDPNDWWIGLFLGVLPLLLGCWAFRFTYRLSTKPMWFRRH